MGWSMGTMCPALATRTNDRGPSRRKVPPDHACVLTLHALRVGGGWGVQALRGMGSVGCTRGAHR